MEYSTAAVVPPTSLPMTPQLFRLCGAPHNRKNWLFVGGDGGLASAAVLMSLCVSAKRHGLNPWAYLSDVLTQLSAKPADVTHLLPDTWAQRHLSANP